MRCESWRDVPNRLPGPRHDDRAMTARSPAMDPSERIRELEAALSRERARSTELQRRADLAEESARRAWRLGAWGGLSRREDVRDRVTDE